MLATCASESPVLPRVEEFGIEADGAAHGDGGEDSTPPDSVPGESDIDDDDSVRRMTERTWDSGCGRSGGGLFVGRARVKVGDEEFRRKDLAIWRARVVGSSIESLECEEGMIEEGRR